MVNKTFNIDVDIKESLTNRPFEVVQGDTGNIINISVLDDGQPVDLAGCRVLAVFSKSSGTSSQDSGVADGGITISGNTVHLQLFTSSFDVGMIECELQIYSDAGMSTLTTTAKFNFKARRGILNNDTVQSTNEYPTLTQLIKQVEDMAGGIPWLPSAEQGDAVFVGPAGQLQGKSAATARAALGITPVNIGAAAATVTVAKILAAAGWADQQQTITDEAIYSAIAPGDVRISQSATDAQFEAWGKALPRVIAQEAGSITLRATGTMPAIEIPIILEVRG